MQIIFIFFIFCLVLFIYLHVYFHLKTGEELEVYEIDQPSKDKLEEICDIRQPIIFEFECSQIMKTSSKEYITSNYAAFDIKIKNVAETKIETDTDIIIPLRDAAKLFATDSFYSENNNDFLQETGIIKNLKYNDEFIRPAMVSNCNYDILLSSEHCVTPFQYKLNYRNYFLVTEGSIQVKLAPPKSSRYLYPCKDYENFEFRSPINPWQVQPKYSADFDKIKCLEITLEAGKTLFIPAYWWYSIKFAKNTSVSCFYYKTYMNNIAILPHIAMHVLQLNNVKRDVVKKYEPKETREEDKELKETETKTKVQDLEPSVPEPANFDNTTTINNSEI